MSVGHLTEQRNGQTEGVTRGVVSISLRDTHTTINSSTMTSLREMFKRMRQQKLV